ncbi:sensor domain-containing diguanylate cyclase [Xanthobacter tagetidis]|uniref:sensor domain-containing diguanylate cyclase n=1 Tax=Xanthobacter tagetidis TaxID=60216 RepID=UPI001473A4E4|nr:sensor domain-containing diguanylate cyclase [Xanthobacter tagetidis]MBB6307067.1 diguanylate cyclase (GGDEF)-like protein [Xanthobacter tagetidis]
MLLLTTAAILVIIALVQAAMLAKLREDRRIDAHRAAENVVRTLALTIDRNLKLIEVSIVGVREALALPEVQAMPASARHLLLFNRIAIPHYLGSMLVLDENGNIVIDSGTVAPRQANFADRDYFKVHRERDAGTFLSSPYASRLRQNDPSIGMTVRLSRADGKFDGVVLAAFRLAFFKSLFEKVDLGPDGIISLVNTDGTMVYRHPSTDGTGNAGESVADAPVFARMRATPNGSFTGTSKIDGLTRYYVTQKIGDFPLILSVGISTSAIFAEWAVQAIIVGLLTLVVCGLLAGIVLVLRRALVHSYNMEEQLEHMAVTDALTQIPNRRALEMALDTEMRRATREKSELSVLVIDLDFFKQINDSHGHAVGDALLRSVGRQVTRAIRRPGDFAARLGGEEFVVILPSTGAAGATFMAERIRKAIAATQVATDDGRRVNTTASIGVASGMIQASDPTDRLLREADGALYRAKGGGRNRVVGSHPNDGFAAAQ